MEQNLTMMEKLRLAFSEHRRAEILEKVRDDSAERRLEKKTRTHQTITQKVVEMYKELGKQYQAFRAWLQKPMPEIGKIKDLGQAPQNAARETVLGQKAVSERQNQPAKSSEILVGQKQEIKNEVRRSMEQSGTQSAAKETTLGKSSDRGYER